MTNQYVYFYFENGKTGNIKCDINFTVREFLDKAEHILNLKYNGIEEEEEDYISYFKDIHCVYIKGRKLEENCHLKDYFNDLKKIPLFITKDPTKLIENSLPFINLDDYEKLSFYSYTSTGYSFKAIDKRTNKEVLIYSIYNQDVITDFKKLYQYKITSTLDHCGIIKVIGFRYPLNKEEEKKTKLLEIQLSDTKYRNRKFDLTGYIFVFEFGQFLKLDSVLTEYLKSDGAKHDKMNPTIRSKIIYGIASIMKYVHQKRIIHNDLQIENIFIDENCEPTISGFMYDDWYFDSNDRCLAIGISFYTTPEIFMGSDEPYSLSVDVYSYAMILYKMFTTTWKFDDKRPIRSSQQFINKIGRGKRLVRPDHIPDSYWELIQRCWKLDPQDRPTFEEIVEELKYDKYSIEEYGMETNLDELHEYQVRMDSY